MFATYKLMHSSTNSMYLDKDLEQLCQEFRQTKLRKKQDKIFAAMFCKVYPMILSIQKKYYSLTNEEKVDHAIFHLYRSIKYYDSTKHSKFSSFFNTHLTNQMKTLLTSHNSLGRAAFANLVTNNEDTINWYMESQTAKPYEMDEEYYIKNELMTNESLSSEEKEYCANILRGFSKGKEIATNMQLTRKFPEITNPLKKYDSQPLTLEAMEQKQKELEEKRELRKIRDVRNSLRQKFNSVKYLYFDKIKAKA